jgi:hypothetical protein
MQDRSVIPFSSQPTDIRSPKSEELVVVPLEITIALLYRIVQGSCMIQQRTCDVFMISLYLLHLCVTMVIFSV